MTNPDDTPYPLPEGWEWDDDVACTDDVSVWVDDDLGLIVCSRPDNGPAPIAVVLAVLRRAGHIRREGEATE